MTLADEALRTLLEGNERFAETESTHPRLTLDRRRQLLGGQRPFAVVLGCSDSRVPPELLFDQGLGDLFVVRTAGHVLGRAALESIEYAVSHLGTPLVLVLAHSDCGAVAATVAARNTAPGEMSCLVSEILPAVEEASALTGDLVNNASKIHARRTVDLLRSESFALKEMERSGRGAAVPAFYDLETGRVEILTG
ncbi:MAG: carbonic anhydrase [Deltaproteobacteria bacterium]|nr:carbonic anhydrase [Deltaproteobacteria bacterium]